MPYIKSYTYVDNDVLTATNHASNEDGLREYVNQEVVAADITADTLSGEVIALPRLIPTVYTTDFVTKTLQGQSKLRLKQQYAWFTSTTKGQNQVSTTVQDYQSMYDTGAEIYIPNDNTTVMITVYMKAFAQENSTTNLYYSIKSLVCLTDTVAQDSMCLRIQLLVTVDRNQLKLVYQLEKVAYLLATEALW